MACCRLKGPAIFCLVGAALALAGPLPAVAQVSGEILVGQPGAALLATVRPPPAAAPDAFVEPEALRVPQPVYPRAARAARQAGRVQVCFTLDERGRVLTPAVRASSDDVFNEPVLAAIGAARFSPARVGNQPVRSTACRTFRFVLR